MGEKDQSVKQDIQRQPGELSFLVIFSLIVIALFIEAVKLDGIFQGFTKGPGTIPQIVLLAMLAMIGMLAGKVIKAGNWFREFLSSETLGYLFSRNVILMLAVLIFYAIFLEILHFKLATFLFLSIMMYLLDPKRPVQKLAVAAGALFFVVVIFGMIFEVVLP